MSSVPFPRNLHFIAIPNRNTTSLHAISPHSYSPYIFTYHADYPISPPDQTAEDVRGKQTPPIHKEQKKTLSARRLYQKPEKNYFSPVRLRPCRRSRALCIPLSRFFYLRKPRVGARVDFFTPRFPKSRPDAV